MKDDRDPFYKEKDRKNAEMIPYLTALFVGLFVMILFVGAVKIIDITKTKVLWVLINDFIDISKEL